MKVKQTVEMKFDGAYTLWRGFTINDINGNTVEVQCTDDNYFYMRDLFVKKCEGIEKERAELAAEQQRALEAKGSEDE